VKKYFYIVLLIISLGIEGCVLVAAGAGAAATAAVVNDKRSIQTITDDKNIEYTASNRIAEDKSISQNNHISIVSFNHAVLMVGQVPSDSVRQRVESIVQSLPKVTRVYNELEISPPTSPLIRSNDAWITTKVKTQMLQTKDLHSGQVKVVTENSAVYLLGVVTRKQAQMASDVARRIDGVQRVVTLFEYTQN
jgi:osmotically-inducible protein OsmY